MNIESKTFLNNILSWLIGDIFPYPYCFLDENRILFHPSKKQYGYENISPSRAWFLTLHIVIFVIHEISEMEVRWILFSSMKQAINEGCRLWLLTHDLIAQLGWRDSHNNQVCQIGHVREVQVLWVGLGFRVYIELTLVQFCWNFNWIFSMISSICLSWIHLGWMLNNFWI